MESYFKTINDAENLHHAIVFESDLGGGLTEILESLESISYQTKGNPDLWIEKYDLLSVDDAREIRKMVLLRPIKEKTRIGIISFLFLTLEAQQALLKTLEELPKDMRIILVTPRTSILLPTVLSRLLTISSDRDIESNNEYVNFISLPIHERVGYIKTFTKKYENLSASEMKYNALLLINTIESEIYKKWDKKESASLNRISILREYLFDPGSSVKIILEEIAILV